MPNLKLQLTGTRKELLAQLNEMVPHWIFIERKVRSLVGPQNKREVWEEQACALALLAGQYDRKSAHILEIGAAKGYTAAVLKCAAPEATVWTVEPVRTARALVRANISSLGIRVRPETSVAFIEVAKSEGLKFDMIFVDGDHKNIALDLPLWNFLKRNGLFVHHDYSAPGSSRECPPVYDNLNQFAELLNHPLDVLVADETGTGLAGFYRTDTKQVWPPEGVELVTGGPWPRWERSSGYSPENGEGKMMLDSEDEVDA